MALHIICVHQTVRHGVGDNVNKQSVVNGGVQNKDIRHGIWKE